MIRTIKSKLSRALPCVKALSSEYAYLSIAFFVPALIMLAVYAIALKIYPFGDGSVLVLDMSGQYVYFFEALRNAIYGEGDLFYSFSRALGGEFFGIYAYYLASPLSYIVALFPKANITEAIFTIMLIKTGLCGASLAFYLHKRTRVVNKAAIIAFSAMYALCSYAVVYQTNTMWIDAMLWLPIVVYATERLINTGRYKLYVVALSMTIMSNYYIGYMVCIFTAIYFIYYYFCSPTSVNFSKETVSGFIKTSAKFLGFSLLSTAISAFVLLGAYYSLTFGKLDYSEPVWKSLLRFDLIDVFSMLFPATYDTVRPEGAPFIYCGLLALLCLPIYFFSTNITLREKIGGAGVTSLLLLSLVLSPLDVFWHGFQFPNWFNSRYSFILCFFLVVLAYRGFCNVRRKLTTYIFVSYGAIIALLIALYEFGNVVFSGTTLAVTIISATLLCGLAVCFARVSTKRRANVICVLVAIVTCTELFVSALYHIKGFDSDIIYYDRSSYDTVDELRPVSNAINEYDASFYRAESLVHRKNNDNLALGLRGLSGSSSTLNESVVSFLADLGYASHHHVSAYFGGTPVSDNLLGVKYLIAHKDKVMPQQYYTLVLTVGDYKVYQSSYYLSLAYGIDNAVSNVDLSLYSTYFEKQNALVSTMCGNEKTISLYDPISEYSFSYEGVIIDTNESYNTYSPAFKDKPATLTYSFVASADAEYYFAIPTDLAGECTVSVNGQELGEYLGRDRVHILSLGNFLCGDAVSVVLRLYDEPITVNKGIDCIWYLNEETYKQAFADLCARPQLITDEGCSDTHITGKVTTTLDSTTMLLTVPYDTGWKIFVDGERVECKQTLDALISFNISGAGEHVVELKYSPNVYWVGMIISIVSVGAFVSICFIDKRKRQRDSAYWNLSKLENIY